MLARTMPKRKNSDVHFKKGYRQDSKIIEESQSKELPQEKEKKPEEEPTKEVTVSESIEEKPTGEIVKEVTITKEKPIFRGAGLMFF